MPVKSSVEVWGRDGKDNETDRPQDASTRNVAIAAAVDDEEKPRSEAAAPYETEEREKMKRI